MQTVELVIDMTDLAGKGLVGAQGRQNMAYNTYSITKDMFRTGHLAKR